MSFDIETFAEEQGRFMRMVVADAVAPLLVKIATLEGIIKDRPAPVSRDEIRSMIKGLMAEIEVPAGEAGKDGRDGKDVDPDLLRELVAGEVKSAVVEIEVPAGEAGKDGRDGKDVDPGLLRELVAGEVKSAVAEIEVPAGEAGKDGRDGKDVDPDLLRELVAGEVKSAVAEIEVPAGEAGKDGRDGKDVDPDLLRELVAGEVKSAVAEIEVPAGEAGKDGKDADEAGIFARLAECLETKFAELPKPKDGRDGRDGRDGKDGVSVEVDELHRAINVLVRDALAEWPKPQDGRDGRDGKDGEDGCDGLSFDDFGFEKKGPREFELTLRRGDRIKAFTLALEVPYWDGDYTAEKTYGPMVMVRSGGHIWMAKSETSQAPGGNDDWQLMFRGPARNARPVKVGDGS